MILDVEQIAMWTGIRRQFAIGIVMGLVLMTVPITMSSAHAEEAPLRLAYIDITESGADASYDAIYEMLDGSAQIDMVDEEDFVDRAAEYGIDRQSLRAGDRRQHEDQLAGVMWRENVESLLLHDLTAEGSRVVVAAIGPRGWELTQINRPLSEGEIDGSDVRAILEEVFVEVVPEVRGFRRDVDQGELSEEDFPLEKQHDDQVDLREVVAQEHRAKYGDLRPNLEVRAGLMTGYRSMSMSESDGDFTLDHNTVLVGPGVRVDSLITTFDRHTAALEVSGFLGGASFVTGFGDEEYAGQYFRFGGEARYIRALSATTRIRGIGGVETTNLSLDPNDLYTGHGYLTARLGGGIHYTFPDLATVQVDALLLPIISASNSGDEYGEATGWLGAGIDAAVHLQIFEPVLASFHYSLQQLNLDYPDSEALEGSGQSRDMFHQAYFMVGYRL